MRTRCQPRNHFWKVFLGGCVLSFLAFGPLQAEAQVFYRSGRVASPYMGPSIYYGNRDIGAGTPRHVTWYTVGGGYTSSLQTGLPWRGGGLSSGVPERLMEAYPGSVARSSRINSREYYVRDVHRRRRIGPAGYPGDRFEDNVEIAGGKPDPRQGSEQVPQTPGAPADVAVPVSDVQAQEAP